MTLGSISCPKCSSQNLNQAQFCCNCGTGLNAANPTHPANNANATAQPFQTAAQHHGGYAMNQQQAFAVQQQRPATMVIIAWVCAGLGLVMLGPLSSIPGAIIAWMDVSASKTQGQMPSMGANLALWANVIVTVISMFLCVGSMMMMPLMMM